MSFEINGAKFYLTANACEDGRLGEVHAKFGKDGSTISGLLDAISTLISLAIQHGVPAEKIIGELANTRYEPMGMTDDADIPEASSVMDYISRRLALDYLHPETRAQLGIFSAAERAPARPALPAAAWQN
jgi:ribonucleoside-diphosphate reductase alpha chain